MTDLTAALREWLLLKAPIMDAVGERVYGDAWVPGDDYRPALGQCICFQVLGATVHETNALIEASVRVKCYGLAENDVDSLARLVYDQIHEHGGQVVRWCYCDVPAEVMQDQRTGWLAAMATYRVQWAV